MLNARSSDNRERREGKACMMNSLFKRRWLRNLALVSVFAVGLAGLGSGGIAYGYDDPPEDEELQGDLGDSDSLSTAAKEIPDCVKELFKTAVEESCDHVNKCFTDKGDKPPFPKSGDKNYTSDCKVKKLGKTECTRFGSSKGRWCTTEPVPPTKCEDMDPPARPCSSSPTVKQTCDPAFQGLVGNAFGNGGTSPSTKQVYCPDGGK